MIAMANIEINLTLEGEEALRVLQAILNKGADVSVTQTPVVEETIKPETQEEVAPKNRARWTEREIDYLSCMVKDHYAEHGLISFRHEDRMKVEAEFFDLCGTIRTWKGMNVRTSIMRGKGDKRFFPDGKKKVKRKKTPKRS